MTLILSLATPEFVVQVADRKLINQKTRQTKDTNTNKMVLFCNRATFGYTGLAQISDVSTDEWLWQTISEMKEESLSATLDHVADRATEVFRGIRYPAAWKKLAFVGVGWTRSDVDAPFYPIICRVSNFHDAQVAGLAEARPQFTVRFSVFRPPGSPWGWLETGASLTKAETVWLDRQLKRCAAKVTGPRPVVVLFAHLIRSVAARNTDVGKNLLAAVIAKGAAGLDTVFLSTFGGRAGFVMGKTGKDRSEAMRPGRAMVFLDIPADRTDGVQYGPRVACPEYGVAMGNLKAGPAPSANL
jgi:hypothetical protein